MKVNCCLICQSSNLNNDFVCLYNRDGTLAYIGKLYEKLFRLNIPVAEPNNYPKFICSTCGTQMTLFKQLITKATETYKMIKKGYKEHSLGTNTKYINTLSDSAIDELDIDAKPLAKQISVLQTNNNLQFIDFANHSDTGDTNEIKIEIELVQPSGESQTNDMYLNVDYLDNFEVEESIQTAPYLEANLKNKFNRKFNCYACGVEFTQRSIYLAHRKDVHRDKLPCPACPKLFSTSDSLQVHLKLHKGPPAFKCELCEKTFNQKVHFKYHMDKHNNIRNFRCEFCNKDYISKADLRIHMRTHNDDRRYPCEICGKSFFLMQHLKMHKYSHGQGKSIECQICLQKFVSPSTLHTHIQTIHTKFPQFNCEICAKKFRRKHHLIAHYNVHEKSKLKLQRDKIQLK